MVDNTWRASIVHYASSRSKRVDRSVMAAELHALTLAFDLGFVVTAGRQEAMNRNIIMDVLTNSKTALDFIARDGRTTERRLQIYVHSLRRSYANG